MLVEVAQAPERTSRMPLNCADSPTTWVAAVAVKLYHTSGAAAMPWPQLAVGARLWVGADTLPAVGVLQSAVTGTLIAEAQSSLAGSTGAGDTQMVKAAAEPTGWLGCRLYTRSR